MKRIIAFMIVVLIAVNLIGCGKQNALLISNESVEVTRTGREIRVVDNATGAEGYFHLVRARRNTGDSAREVRVGSLQVISGHGVMVITDGASYWIVKLK